MTYPYGLKVQINEETDRALADLAEVEPHLDDGQPLNKTTLINRAVQAYADIRRNQAAGGEFAYRAPGSDEMMSVRYE